jgi:signal transduction histidine kinase
MFHRWVTGSSMDKVKRSELVWVVFAGLVALIVPTLAGYVVFDQSRVPMLGIYVNDTDPPIIAEVMAGSAAASAGLQKGDAILAVDGLPYAAWSRRLGQTHAFDLIRQGQPLTLQVTMGSMLQANWANAISAILVALTFWGAGLLLLRRRFRQTDVRLLFLLFQACAAALLIGLTYPRFRLPQPWLVSLAVASLIVAAPLLLHLHLTFPVALATPGRRVWVLVPLYGLALAGAIDAWRRPVPWTSPAVFGALLVGVAAFGVAAFVYFRRASADGRRRVRVVFAGTIVGFGLPMVAYILPNALMGYSPAIPRWSISLFLAIVPLSYLYAIGRHDLFGIDHLLNRATVYAVVSAEIFVLCLMVLFLLYRAAPHTPLLQGTVITGLTLCIAFTFQPARTRVQRRVDQLFYGGWYDYPGVVEQASAALARSREWADLAGILTREIPKQMHLRGAQLAIGERSASTLEADAKAGLEISLDCGGQACGAWTVGPRRDGEALHPEDQRILQTLAREAEISLSNVLLVETLRGQLDEIRASRETLVQLQHQLLRSREAERGRLARDLHDGPIQTLVGMNMQLGMLMPAMNSAGDALSTTEALQDVRGEVRSLLGELRQVCTELRPPMLDTLGLGAALHALAEEWSAQQGVAVRLDLPPDATLRCLPEEVAVNLYRVAQEALSNVARHAEAHQVDLRLAWGASSGRLDLTIRDDGRGFAPAAIEDLTGQGHFGLAGIRERAAIIDGKWRLESTPGQGTTVRVIWQGNDRIQGLQTRASS